jgi:two-component sensor histidine kinase
VLGLAELMRGYLDTLESEEEDPEVLGLLYRVDHAATRVQRLAENLQVLAGGRSGEVDGQVTPLIDVIRAGMSAIEHYSRVHIGPVVNLAVVDWAADDVGRVMSELLDNATRYSPPTSTVSVSAHLTEQGTVMFRVQDVGIGFDPVRLKAVNAKLNSQMSGLDPEAPTQLGLPVVQLLARTHGIRVELVKREPVGTTAMVLLPVSLLCEYPVRRARRPQPRPSPRLASRHGDEQGNGTGLAVRSSHLSMITPSQTTTGGTRRVAEASTPPEASQPLEGRLPQRVPSSIRQLPEVMQFRPPAELEAAANQQAWHDDLAAFVAGEAAAYPDDKVGSSQHRPEGSNE